MYDMCSGLKHPLETLPSDLLSEKQQQELEAFTKSPDYKMRVERQSKLRLIRRVRRKKKAERLRRIKIKQQRRQAQKQ
jgi:hypothetical protein